jgi:serine-type D-Ala-D-Ala carboxypeptidase/endopeptidase (penicillin-binding protein 4)
MTFVGRVFRPGVLALALISGACAAKAAPATAPSSPVVRQLQADLSTIFNAPVMARGVWGVDIRSVDTGQVLFQHNADRLMMPASNMKILTLAAAAHTLGWEHRFTTSLLTTAPIENGVLKGDVIVRGTGDPTISTRNNRLTAVFDQWAQDLRAAGITTIEGRIIGDDNVFDDEGIGPGWAWDYLEAGYASPIGALQYNENIADVTIAPGAAAGDPAVVTLTPGTGLQLVNLVRTVAADTPGGADVRTRRRIDRPEIEIAGVVPVGVEAVRRTIAVLNPTLFLAQATKDALSARGIPVQGAAVDGDDVGAALVQKEGGEPRVLASTPSPTLREIGTTLMKVSQNQFAETLLKATGAARGGLGTTDGGRAVAQELFTQWKIPRDSYVMSDGSGLSRYNYIAPSTITTVLRKMHADPAHREAFLATLPVAATDGTIATRMRGTRAAGNARAKTGSIANVRSLSGFVKSRDGETFVFAIIANDFVLSSATVNYIADVAVETLANFTRK